MLGVKTLTLSRSHLAPLDEFISVPLEVPPYERRSKKVEMQIAVRLRLFSPRSIAGVQLALEASA